MALEYRSVSAADLMIDNPKAVTPPYPDDHPQAKAKRPN